MPSGATEPRNRRLNLVSGCGSAASTKDAPRQHGAKRPSRFKTDMTHRTRRRLSNRQRSRRHILPSPQMANVTPIRRIGAPRPTRLRMTMAGSRFPGSRVNASDHLPRIERIPVAFMAVGYPPTVAGGGSCGIVCRSRRTPFPWLALAGTTNHDFGIGLIPGQSANRTGAPAFASTAAPCP
jgi:hypothetical protein